MRMRVINYNRYNLPTAMLTTQQDCNAMYKMQRIIEHISIKSVKACIQYILNVIKNDSLARGVWGHAPLRICF